MQLADVRENKGGITWLHLSDWHQKKSGESDRQLVLDALISDIKERNFLSPHLYKIDFIVYSGDVAFSGQPEEYIAARRNFFNPLLEAANLRRDQLFIVPGNHDLNKKKIYKLKYYCK